MHVPFHVFFRVSRPLNSISNEFLQTAVVERIGCKKVFSPENLQLFSIILIVLSPLECYIL